MAVFKKCLPILLTTLITCIQQPIKIGVVADLSGSGRDLGWSIVKGTELAVEEYNEHSLGPRIKLLVRDDQGDSLKAIRIAKRLVDMGIVGVIGHMNSHCSIAAAPIYEKDRIPMITPSSTAPRLTEEGWSNVFRICGRDDLQGRIAAHFVKENLKSKRIIIIADKSIYGQGLAHAFAQELETKVVGRIDYEVGDMPTKTIKRELHRQLPDLVYFAGLYRDGSSVLKLIDRKMKFVSGDGIATDEFLRMAGNLAENIYFTFGPPTHQLGAALHFLRIAKEKRVRVEPYTCNAYDATRLLIDAYFRSKGTDLVNFIHSNSFDGSTGIIQFNSKGDIVNSPFMIWTVEGGRFKPWTREIIG